MVGADVTTELWRPPKAYFCLFWCFPTGVAVAEIFKKLDWLSV